MSLIANHSHQQTTTVQVQISGRTILESVMNKFPSPLWRAYRVALIVPNNGIPMIEYQQKNSKKLKKHIHFSNLLFADRRHDCNEKKFILAIYAVNKTVSFVAKDETTLNEWLTRISEYHSNAYPDFKKYEHIFEAELLARGLAETMNISGKYRVALCKDSIDLIPIIDCPNQIPQSGVGDGQQSALFQSSTHAFGNVHHFHHSHLHHHHHHHHHHGGGGGVSPSTTNQSHSSFHSSLSSSSSSHAPSNNSMVQYLPSHQRFYKRHPMLAVKTIELLLKSIRRCGHTDCNFYIEPGRHSQLGAGDLWMQLSKRSVARRLHEILLTNMKLASTSQEEQFACKPPRSRSGSSSDAHRQSVQSRSSSVANLGDSDSDGYLPMS